MQMSSTGMESIDFYIVLVLFANLINLFNHLSTSKSL
jgi:hypothetical protein